MDVRYIRANVGRASEHAIISWHVHCPLCLCGCCQPVINPRRTAVQYDLQCVACTVDEHPEQTTVTVTGQARTIMTAAIVGWVIRSTTYDVNVSYFIQPVLQHAPRGW